MIVYVSRHWRIDASDGLNFIVQRKKEGQTTWKNLGYYPNLGLAAQNLISKMNAYSEATTDAESFLKEYERITNRLIDVLQGAIHKSQAALMDEVFGDLEAEDSFGQSTENHA